MARPKTPCVREVHYEKERFCLSLFTRRQSYDCAIVRHNRNHLCGYSSGRTEPRSGYGLLRCGRKSPELSGHILGLTDAYQDVYSRLLYGGRVSLTIGIGSTVIGLLIGVFVGLIAGYYGGKIDTILMRTAEIFISFPSMVLLLVMVSICGANIGIVCFLLGFLGWPSAAKLIESNVRSVVQKEYIEAAHAIGKSSLKIIFQDVMPNVLGPVLVTIPFRVSAGNLSEASLSFLGVGIENSWGKTINYALSSFVMQKETWIWVPACVLLVTTIIAINLLGEGIRDAFDPKLLRR